MKIAFTNIKKTTILVIVSMCLFGFFSSSVLAKQSDVSATDTEKELEIKKKKFYEDLEQKYKDALNYFKQKEYLDAKEKFSQIEWIMPGYKSAKDFIAKIDEILAKEVKEQKVDLVENFKKKVAEEKRNETKKIVVDEKQIEKAQKIEEKRKELQLQKDLKSLYEQAILLYKNNKFSLAKDKFEQLRKMMPDYKSTEKYLVRINEKLADEKIDAVTIDIEKSDEVELKEKIVTFKAKKEDEGFVLNLKQLIDKSKQKIQQADEKIKEQAILRRNQQREEKSRIYYEKAMEYFDAGNFSKAKANLEKAIKITKHPEMKGYVHQSVKKQKKTEQVLKQEEKKRIKRLEEDRGYSSNDVEKTYNLAVTAFEQNDYIEARDLFEQVDEMFPDHKATKSYIMLIDQKIKEEQERQITLKVEQEEIESKNKKIEWQKNLNLQEKLRKEKVQYKAEELYKEALNFYKIKEFDRAKEKFREVEWTMPNYKSTIKYLSRVDKDIVDHKKELARLKEESKLEGKNKEQMFLAKKNEVLQRNIDMKSVEEEKRKKEEAEFVYQSALSLYRMEKYKDARNKFYEANSIIPGYRSSEKYINKLSDMVGDTQEDIIYQSGTRQLQESSGAILSEDALVRKLETERIKHREQQVLFKYKEAVDFYGSGNFQEAKIKFIEVEAIYPNYKDTIKYLSKIDEDISSQKPVKPQIYKTENRIEKEQKKEAKSISAKIHFEQEADEIYQMARSLYRNREYEQSRQKFEEVQRLVPTFKKTSKYLNDIEKIINKESRKSGSAKIVTAKVSKPKVKIVKEKQDKVVKQKSPVKQETKVQEIAEDVEKVSIKEFASSNNDVKQMYKRAVKLYRNNEFDKAKFLFERIYEISPNYRNTVKYLKVSGRNVSNVTKKKEMKTIKTKLNELDDFEKHNKIDTLAKTEEEELRLSRLKRHNDVLKKRQEKEFNKIQSEIDNKIKDQQQKREDKFQSYVESVYNEAVGLYQKKSYHAAKIRFSTVEGLSAGYKSAESYIEKLDKIIADEDLKIRQEAKRRIDDEKAEKERKILEEERLRQAQEERKRQEELERQRLAEQLKQEKLEAKLKEEEYLKSLITKRENAKAKARTEYELIKSEQAKALEARKEENSSEIKKQIKVVYEELLVLFKEDQFVDYAKKYKQFDYLLANKDVPSRYRDSTLNDLNKDKKKIEKSKEKERKKLEKETRKKELELKKQRKLLDQKRKEEYKLLAGNLSDNDQKVVSEESHDILVKSDLHEDKLLKLQEERQKLDEKLKNKENKYLSKISLSDQNSDQEVAQAKDIEYSIDDKIKKNEKKIKIDDAFELKKKQLEQERESIEAEYQDNMERLYESGMDFYKKQMYLDAEKAFAQVVSMDPNYKKSQNYLKEITAKKKKLSNDSAQQRVKNASSNSSIELEPINVYLEK